MAVVVDQNFNSGASLASLGFIATVHVANTAAAGADGSYAMACTDGDDLGETTLPLSQSCTEVCHSFVWVPAFVTDWELIGLHFAFGLGYAASVVLYTQQSDASLFLFPGGVNPEWWHSTPGVFSIGVPLYVRLYVKVSSTSNGVDLNPDGAIALWLGPSAGSMVQVANLSGLEIDGLFETADSVVVTHVVYGPQGSMDDLYATNAACFPTLPVLVNDNAECCSGQGVEGSGVSAPGAGVDQAAIPDPTWTPRMMGGGQLDGDADLTDPEDWSDA